MNLRKLLSSSFKKHKTLYLTYALLFIISSFALSITPYVSSRLIGCFSTNTKETLLKDIFFWLTVFGIAKTLQAINQYFVRIHNDLAHAMLKKDLMLNLFKTVHAHSVSYFDDEMTGRISTAVNKISDTIREILIGFLYTCFRPLINFILAYALIACASTKLAITLFLLCIPFYFIIRKMLSQITGLFRERGKYEREYCNRTVDSLTNYKIVRYTGSIFNERHNAYKLLKKYLRTTYECETKRGFSTLFLNMSESFFTTACYIAILYFTAADTLSVADAFFAFQSIHMLSKSLSDLNQFTIDTSSSYAELATNIELIYKPIKIKNKENATKLKVSDNSVSFKNIDFSYVPEKPVFSNLNLHIPANQKIGLVGFSGAGKSTLINLLLRSYLPQNGEITIGFQNIADITEQSLHQNIAYVPQDVTLFNRSLMENLKLANPKATEEDIVKATKLANIHQTILNLPKGYDSIVGERGILLSGGERQRLAIARAIIQNAPILILDEATSALDSQSEIMVQQAIENLMQNKTVIAIAHRLSTLRSMDRIIVLENGVIKEDGTPQALLKKKSGIFKHLYSLQSDGYITINNKEKN